MVEINDIPVKITETPVEIEETKEPIAVIVKAPVILAIDPGFVRCGFALLNANTSEYIDSY